MIKINGKSFPEDSLVLFHGFREYDREINKRYNELKENEHFGTLKLEDSNEMYSIYDKLGINLNLPDGLWLTSDFELVKKMDKIHLIGVFVFNSKTITKMETFQSKNDPNTINIEDLPELFQISWVDTKYRKDVYFSTVPLTPVKIFTQGYTYDDIFDHEKKMYWIYCPNCEHWDKEKIRIDKDIYLCRCGKKRYAETSLVKMREKLNKDKLGLRKIQSIMKVFSYERFHIKRRKSK